MTIKAFKKPGAQNQEVALLSQAVEDFTLPLTANPLLDGELIQGIALTTSAKLIPHRRGRRWIGFLVTNNDTGERVYSTSKTLDTKFISLQATGACTVDVWVF